MLLSVEEARRVIAASLDAIDDAERRLKEDFPDEEPMCLIFIAYSLTGYAPEGAAREIAGHFSTREPSWMTSEFMKRQARAIDRNEEKHDMSRRRNSKDKEEEDE